MFESKYYNTKVAKKGDILTLLTDPKEETTQWGPKVKCQIDLDGAKMEWGICNTAGKAMRLAFGDPLKKSWVGKKVEVVIEKTKTGVEFINVIPIEQIPF